MAQKSFASSPKDVKPVLVLDVGTTGIKAFVFKGDVVLGRSYKFLKKAVRGSGPTRRVEQDPMEMVRTSRDVLRQAVKASGVSVKEIKGMSIVNQRETFVVWRKTSGKPVYPAIVWQDGRTAEFAEHLAKYFEATVKAKTGLPLIPYFSATKVRWVLDRLKGNEKGLLFGTVDSWLLWNLAKGRPHRTDQTNASRTLLFNVHACAWDKELLDIFGVPRSILPKALPAMAAFGRLDKNVLGREVPIVAMCGDQQASLFAAGTTRGVTKVTYGTGAFLAQSLGSKFEEHAGFFTTLAPSGKRPVYMLEAKLDDCGKRITPLIGKNAAMHKEVSKIVEIVARSIKTLPFRPKRITVDGGVTQYEPLMQIQTAITRIPAVRQKIYDGTALGAARLIYAADSLKG